MAAQDQDHAAYDDEEDDLEDTEGDDSDMDDYEDDDVSCGVQPPAGAPPAPAATISDLNAAASIQPLQSNPNPSPCPAPAAAPQNGTVQVFVSSSGGVSAASGGDVQTATPDPKRPRIEERRPQLSASFDESRRLFQRLWTDDDEIKILKGFLEFTASRGTQFASHQYDTGPFYEQIKNELQLDFNKNQLIEKLRRLKKKYRNTANRMVNHGKEFTFKSPHEKATYDIARKIWSASIKRSRDSDDDDLNPYANNISDAAVSSDRKIARSRRRGRKRSLETLPATPVLLALPPPPQAVVGSVEGVVKVEVQTAPITTPVLAAPVTTPVLTVPVMTPSLTTPTPILPPPSIPSAPQIPVVTPQIPTVIEETVKSCLSPIFKELLSSAVSAPLGLGVNLPPLLNSGGNLGSLSASDDRWKQQQILELEVYLKRVELVRDQIKSMLEEMKSSKPAAESAPAGS